MEQVEVVVAHHERATLRVFVDVDRITGVIDRSGASRGDALFDLATLTLGHEEHLDLDVIRAWWSLRILVVVCWLLEHGFDPFSPGCEVDVLTSQM